MAAREKLQVLRVLPRAVDGPSEWVPDRAICALKLHLRLVALLVEKLELPNLQELRLRRERSETSITEDWQSSAGGALYRRVRLECPLWQRLWSGLEAEQEGTPATFVLSQKEIRLLREVELHVTCCLMHLGHASSHLHSVGGLFTAKLQRSEPDTVLDTTLQATDEGDQELSPVSLVSPEAGQSPRDDLALRFDECLDQLVEVLWSFYLRLQLVHAVFVGDVFRLVHWSLRLLGLSQPWPLRRLHDFTLSTLELFLEQAEDVEEEKRSESQTLLADVGAFYLGVPVIPRMQARMRGCLHGLRRNSWLELELLDALLAVEEVNFDAKGENLVAFRREDPLHQRFQRCLREAVIGRVDRSCSLDGRRGVQALCNAPLSGAWTKSRRCQPLQEVLSSLPQEPRHHTLQLLDEDTPEERAMQSELQKQSTAQYPRLAPSFFCEGVCSGKALEG